MIEGNKKWVRRGNKSKDTKRGRRGWGEGNKERVRRRNEGENEMMRGSNRRKQGKLKTGTSGIHGLESLTMLLFLSFCLFTRLSSLLLSFFRAVSTSSLSSCTSSLPPLSPLVSLWPLCWRYSMKPFTSSSRYSFFLRLGFLISDPPG